MNRRRSRNREEKRGKSRSKYTLSSSLSLDYGSLPYLYHIQLCYLVLFDCERQEDTVLLDEHGGVGCGATRTVDESQTSSPTCVHDWTRHCSTHAMGEMHTEWRNERGEE